MELSCCSMLAHYQKGVDSFDTRLKVAEDTAQAQSMDSMNAATNKSGIPIATANIETLDQFMVATTDDKLLNNDDRNNDRGGINKWNPWPALAIVSGRGKTPLLTLQPLPLLVNHCHRTYRNCLIGNV
jgi:hypothetical protein